MAARLRSLFRWRFALSMVYNPTLAISIGGEVTKWFAVQNKLGVIVGLRLENKAMTTNATVKNYGMEILGQGGERISGVWTGGVKTKYTLPDSPFL